MAFWKLKEKVSHLNFGRISINPIVADIIAQRKIKNEEDVQRFLYSDYQRDLLDPFLFPLMENLINRIEKARKNKEKIVIFGDYDADGITSSVILQEAFDDFGIKSQVYIPDKKNEGYGLNLEAIKNFKKQKTSLIITVDCGISSLEEVQFAREVGIDVIIIDHHHIPPILPSANIIINPHLSECKYPYKNLAGVGVTFKVIQALYQKFLPEKTEQLKWMLDLVAIGTIADCVPLLEENRLITKFGLIVLGKTRRVGLQELFSVGRILIDENNFPDARKIAFQIAPRINAAGRMNHASIAFNLLRETNRVRARNLALELEAANQERQRVTNKVFEEIKILGQNLFKNKNFIFAVGEHFPIGITGLAAGKISDFFHKPTIVLQKGKKESIGSLRSVSQINIIKIIEKCSHLLVKYGGHEQAAGITVRNEKLEEFYTAFEIEIEKTINGKELHPEIEIDLEIFPKNIDNNLLESINLLEPFGEQNEEPVFLMRNLIVEEIHILGKNKKHLKLFLKATKDVPKMFEAIGFSLAEKFNHFKKGNKLDVVFTFLKDNWNGHKKIQLKLIDIKFSE